MIKSAIQSFIDDPIETFAYLLITIIFISTLIMAAYSLIFHPLTPDVCTIQTSQLCIDKRFDECMTTERYSRAECIQIVGSGK